MRKNKSMLTKTVFYGLGVSLIIGSLVVPLGMGMLNQNVANTLVRDNISDNKGIENAKNFLVDSDFKEQPSVLSPAAVNQDLGELFNISVNGELSVKDKQKLENYLSSHGDKLVLDGLGNGVVIIGENCFSNISNLHTVTISASVKEIGQGAFAECGLLKEVIFAKDSKLEKINKNAFQSCFDLKKITIPESVTEIDSAAFKWCTSLEEITIPRSVNRIGSGVFFQCKKLTSDNVINRSPVLFDWWVKNHQYESGQTMSQMAEINLSQFTNSDGENFNVIGGSAFKENTKLRKISFENCQLSAILDDAFAGCVFLKEITIPASVNYIGQLIFDEKIKPEVVTNNSPVLFEWWVKNHKYEDEDGKTMSQMSEIDLSKLTNSDKKGFSVISDFAFSDGYGENLTNVTIPESVKEIGYDAFGQCKNLTSNGFINNSPVLFDWWVRNHQYEKFENKTMSQIIEKEGIVNLSQFCNTKGNQFKIIGDRSFYDSMRESNLKSIIIPEEVTKIFDGAFFGCHKLENVIFQGKNDQLSLGYDAFQNAGVKFFYFEDQKLLDRLCDTLGKNRCRLNDGDFVFDVSKALVGLTEAGKGKETLIIPNSVTTIGNSAFVQSENLQNITIPESVTNIGNNAFGGCSKLESIKFDAQSQLQQIGAGAFEGCTSLTSIVIPGLVSEIGARAFDNCNHLESVTFLGQRRGFNLGKEVFPQNIKQFYFNDEDLFNWLQTKVSAGIIIGKCVLVKDYFEINGDKSLIAINPNTQKLSELIIPGFVKEIGNGTNVVFGESAKFQKVIIPTSVDKINANAFNSCSLKEVIINSTGVTIESNAFVNMPDTQYYVPANAGIEEQLKKIGIKENQIHFLNLSDTSVDYAIIGLIVGAIAFSIIALGLGIGIPMRRQHRINVLNAKIISKRMDKLSSATALSFKKILEASAKTNRKIDKLEAQNRLIAANVNRPVNRFSQPNHSTNFKPPIKNSTK